MEELYTVFKGGRLIDGLGGAPVDKSVLVVKGKKIEAVGAERSVPIPPGAKVIDVTGKTIMPGLIDAHLHLLGIKTNNPLNWVLDPPELRGMRATMDIWKLIDCGNPNALHLKKAVEEGSIVGPRIVSCGAIISQTAGHGDVHFLPIDLVRRQGFGRIADGVDECRKAAREQLRAGADFIKLCSTGGVMSEKDLPTSTQYSLEEIRAMVEEAHSVGAKCASHAQGTKGIKNALLAGVDTIEHGIFLDEETVGMMIKQKTFLVPTLSFFEAAVTRGPKCGLAEVNLTKARQIQAAHVKFLQIAINAGVKICTGTDYLSDPMTPMGENIVELELQVRAGRSPMDVIVSATKINSEALGLNEKLGTLEGGKLADLLIVQGDPLQNISVLHKENIMDVYKEGVKIPRLS
jgi:imidazolonepropionase-like amidohydrolase